MSTLDTTTFLTLEGNTISVGQAFSCLQLFGRLQPFVQEFLRYYTVYKEIQARQDLVVTSAELAQIIMDFRLQADLTDPERFRNWLTNQGIDFSAFESQTVIGLKLEKLKNNLMEAGAESYFAENSSAFDQVEVFYAAIANADLAQQLKEQIAAGTSFDQIAQNYPLDVAQTVVVKRDILRRQQLREEIKTAVKTAQPGELVGPIPMGDRWCLLRLERVLPAVLDNGIRQEIREILFNQWLAEKLQELNQSTATLQANNSDLTETQADSPEVLESIS